MNAKRERKSHNRKICVAIALLAISITAAPVSFAGGKSKGGDAENVTVVSHVEFTAGTAGKMRLTKMHKSRLIYIGFESSQDVRVVDVTNPTQPRLVDQSSGTTTAPKVTAVKTPASAPELLALLNGDGASNGGEVHKFSASASFLTDARHRVIYVLDNDGLWIVKVKPSVAESTGLFDDTDHSYMYGG